jgi:hypothetical protein
MATESGDIDTVRALTKEEFNVSNSGPAILTNRFYIAYGAWGVRIAFAEQQVEDTPAAFRTAVVMSIQDGIALYKSLQQLLKEPEANLQELTTETQSAQ